MLHCARWPIKSADKLYADNPGSTVGPIRFQNGDEEWFDASSARRAPATGASGGTRPGLLVRGIRRRVRSGGTTLPPSRPQPSRQPVLELPVTLGIFGTHDRNLCVSISRFQQHKLNHIKS